MMFYMPSEFSFAQIRPFLRKLDHFEGLDPNLAISAVVVKGGKWSKISRSWTACEIRTRALKTKPPRF